MLLRALVYAGIVALSLLLWWAVIKGVWDLLALASTTGA